MEELINNFKAVMIKSFDFSGRASRREYWMYVLAVFVINILLSILARTLFIFAILPGLFGLLTLISSISVCVRRLHDIGKSGWWMFLSLVPIVGWIVLFVWSVTEGDNGSNSYGGTSSAKESGVPLPAESQSANPFSDSEVPKENPFDKQS